MSWKKVLIRDSLLAKLTTLNLKQYHQLKHQSEDFLTRLLNQYYIEKETINAIKKKKNGKNFSSINIKQRQKQDIQSR